jgi:F-type H+-transporting ATPase subunit a
MEHLTPYITVAGIKLDLSFLIMLVVTSLITFAIGRLALRGASVTNPTKMQNFLEWVVEFVINIIGTTMDYSKKGKIYLTLGLTLIIYIFVGNMLGLPFAIVTEVSHHSAAGAHHAIEVPKLFGYELNPEGFKEVTDAAKEAGKEAHYAYSWWKSPTANASVTMALALMVIALTHIEGMRRNARGYWSHYIYPNAAFLPLNLIKVVAKPLSLGLRLYGNIFAGEVMIGVIISGLAWIGLPALIVWQGFSIFVGAVQAFVFTMLTMVYISQEVVSDDHH